MWYVLCIFLPVGRVSLDFVYGDSCQARIFIFLFMCSQIEQSFIASLFRVMVRKPFPTPVKEEFTHFHSVLLWFYFYDRSVIYLEFILLYGEM